MKCPRCQTHDVYVSESSSPHILSFLMVSARCHRCCMLFQVPRWKNVPKRPKSSGNPLDLTDQKIAKKRAA